MKIGNFHFCRRRRRHSSAAQSLLMEMTNPELQLSAERVSSDPRISVPTSERGHGRGTLVSDAFRRCAVASWAVFSVAVNAWAAPPFRAIVLEPSLGSTPAELLGPFSLAYWPTIRTAGDGLRFRIVRGDTVVGTILEYSEQGGTTCRAARWRPRTEDSSSLVALLPLPPGAIGSVAADGNDAGVVVGGLINDASDGSRVAASVWFPDAELAVGAGAATTFFGPGAPACGGQPTASMAWAIGTADSSVSRNALAVGAVAAVQFGNWPRAFASGVTIDGSVGDPFGDPSTGDWCSSWSAPSAQPASFSQAVIAPTSGQFPSWEDCYALGSRRRTVSNATSFCVQSQFWDGYMWSRADAQEIVPHCPACSGGEPSRAPCVRYEGADLVTVSDVRLSSIALGNEVEGIPAAYAGLIQERRAETASACSSEFCAVSHAAVVIESIGPDPGRRLFDLHNHTPATAARILPESGIARVITMPASEGGSGSPWRWVAVGAAGEDFRDPSRDRRGRIWIGREAENESTQWCAFDADDITLRPPGVTVAAIHDITHAGVAVAIGWRTDHASVVRTVLLLLTDPADINGDLRVTGQDLGLLLGEWGPVSPNGTDYADMNNDGVVNGSDLGLFLGRWDWIGLGTDARCSVECSTDQWVTSTPIPISVVEATQALGFSDLEELGTFARSLPEDNCLQLCETVSVVAAALRGGN